MAGAEVQRSLPFTSSRIRLTPEGWLSTATTVPVTPLLEVVYVCPISIVFICYLSFGYVSIVALGTDKSPHF